MRDSGQERAPLYDALRAYVHNGLVPFHMPGHKQGKGVDPSFRAFLGDEVFQVDLTEVPGLDDLHAPRGVIKEAQELAALAFGADYTFFSVNGATAAIQASILATCSPGDEIILPRDCHRSIIAAVILAGLDPVYILPEIHPMFGISLGVSYSDVRKALKSHPRARVLLVTTPNYYGVASEIKTLTDLAHECGKIILVDEAHGSHFTFHMKLPRSGLEAGADIVVHGFHKTLASLTQTAMVHIKGDKVDAMRVNLGLRLLQTTSPSFVLMASLDVARQQMVREGNALLSTAIEIAQQARARINSFPGLVCLGPEILENYEGRTLDPTKLVVSVCGLGLTGPVADRVLRENYGIQVELADLENVLAMVTIGDTREDVARLVGGFEGLAGHRLVGQPGTAEPRISMAGSLGPLGLPVPPQVMSPREAFFRAKESVAFREAAGMVCAEFLALYPPGVPIVWPGEELTSEVIEFVEQAKDAGLGFQGPGDPSLTTIQVVTDVEPSSGNYR